MQYTDPNRQPFKNYFSEDMEIHIFNNRKMKFENMINNAKVEKK